MRWRVLGLLLLLAGPTVAAEDNELGLSYLETPDARVIYFDAIAPLAPLTLRTLTNSLAFQRRIFGWTPSERTTVLMMDFADTGSGAATATPRNSIFLESAPLSLAFETYPAAERLYTLLNHETVHVAAADIASSPDLFWRRLLRGKVTTETQHPESLFWRYLTAPRWTAPRWLIEGGAVFLETWMAGGLGRAQGGYDEMVFRAMVRDGAPFFDPLALESRAALVDFQTGVNAYLYGTRFVTWLALAHGPDKLLAWLRRDEGSERHYAAQFKLVYGRPLNEAWAEWIAFEREFQRKNLESVRKFPITPEQRLLGRGIASMSRTFFDEASGTLYGAIRTPGDVDHLAAIDTRTGEVRRLTDIKRGMLYRVASLAYDPDRGTLFFTNNNLGMRDLMSIDARGGEPRLLIKRARIGEIVFNRADRSLIGVRHDAGFASLVRIAPPYTEWEEIRRFDYGVVPFDLDVSPDGRLLSASVYEVSGDQFLRVWDLARLRGGDLKPLSQYHFGQSVPESFVFSPDGRYLYGSSYFTGVSNIFRYEVANGAVEAVSNAESGFFRPMPMADGRLVVLSYGARGFVPAIIEPRVLKDVSAITFLGAQLAEKHPVVTTWQVPPPSTVDETKLITAQGPYFPTRHLSLSNAYPVVMGYRNRVGPGVRINFEDPLRFAQVSATLAVTSRYSQSRDDRLHVDIRGEYLGWKAGIAWNKADFADIFGPTRRSRSGLEVMVGNETIEELEFPKKRTFKWSLTGYSGLDSPPTAQNVTSPLSRLVVGEAGWSFTDLRRAQAAVDDERGLAWNARAQATYGGGKLYPNLRGNVDLGIPLPLPHASIWLRNAAGVASGDADDPYANFFFGGFGNNRVDTRAPRRFRDTEAFPGFEIGDINGRSFVRSMVEFTPPYYAFEPMGWPGFHPSYARSSIFAAGLWTEPASSQRRATHLSVGAQVDLRFSSMHWNETMLSLGVATGYREGRRVRTEWMVSLKLL